MNEDYTDEYIAQTAPEDFVFEMRDELFALRQWAQAAYVALQHGVQLMPLDQIGQWDGVRSVIESAPDYCGDDNEDDNEDDNRFLSEYF